MSTRPGISVLRAPKRMISGSVKRKDSTPMMSVAGRKARPI